MMFGWGAPVVVIAVLAWLTGAPTTIGELAQREALRRTLLPKSTRSYSNNDLVAWSSPLGAPALASGAAAPDAPPAATADPADPKPPVEAPHDEAWWSGRITNARGTLTRDTMLSEAVQSRINALTSDVTSRDDPAQKAQLDYERRQAIGELDRLQKAIVSDKKDIADIEEDARKQGVPAGWIR
jgi:hypothetical protein